MEDDWLVKVLLDKRRTTAAHRKKIREILFVYRSILDGWCVQLISPGKYHITRSAIPAAQ